MDYCLGGIQAGVRADGRGLLDYRACVVESDTLLHANGSAIVVLGGLGRGNTTRVLGVVKAEVCKCEYHPSTTTVYPSTIRLHFSATHHVNSSRIQLNSRIQSRSRVHLPHPNT